MVTMFGCPRSKNTHIEKKKSKCDYILDSCPTDEQVAAILARVKDKGIEKKGLLTMQEFEDILHQVL